MNKLNKAVGRIKELEGLLAESRRVVFLLMNDAMSYAFYMGDDPEGGDGQWVAYNHNKTKERHTELADRREALALAGLEEGDVVASIGSHDGGDHE